MRHRIKFSNTPPPSPWPQLQASSLLFLRAVYDLLPGGVPERQFASKMGAQQRTLASPLLPPLLSSLLLPPGYGCQGALLIEKQLPLMECETCCACEASVLVPTAASLSALSTLRNVSWKASNLTSNSEHAMPSRRGISWFKRNSLKFFSSLCLLRFQDAAKLVISSTELHTCDNRHTKHSKEH